MDKEKEKKLPVTLKPFIRPFSQYIFMDIVMNNEATTGECLAKLSLENEQLENWMKYEQGARIHFDNNQVIVMQDMYTGGATKYIYKKFVNPGSVLFHIDYQQYTNRWDAIEFFISNTSFDINSDEPLFNLARFCSGYIIVNANGTSRYFNYDDLGENTPNWFLIEFQSKQINVSCALDEKQWKLLCQIEIELPENGDLIYGFNFNLEDAQYYKWIFNNFIQLRFAKTEVKLIYTNLMKRDWRIYAINPIVKTAYEKTEFLNQLGISLWDYIKANIDKNRYIEFWLNEYYIPGMEAYKKRNFVHEGFVYGYNDENKTIHMISIYNGKPVKLQVTYDEFLAAYQNRFKNKETIYLFEYNPTDAPYRLELEYIFHTIEDYLEGRNTSEDYGFITPREDGSYGIDIYDEIIDSEECKELFLTDRKIAYVLLEHKKCMYERMKYIFTLLTFDAFYSNEILRQLGNIVDMAELSLNKVLKNIKTPNKNLQDSLWKLLVEIRDAEKKCLRDILRLVYLL